MARPVFLDRKEAKRRIVELGKRFGFEIDPDVKVGELSVGWQQRVEILKALYRNARVLVLDEPTAVLTPQETEEIFAVLRRLAEQGHSIVFISHKLYEVLEIADRITVIRRGRVVGHADPVRDRRGGPCGAHGRARRAARRRPRRVASRRACASRSHGPARCRRPRQRGRRAASTSRSGRARSSGSRASPGNGQDELVEAIVGLRKPAAGTVTLDGKDVTNASAARDDEPRHGLRPGRPPSVRAGARRSRSPTTSSSPTTTASRTPAGSIRNDDAIEERGAGAVKEYDIRTPSRDGHRRDAVRRQPAEDRRRPRARRRAAAARPRPADARPRRRQHRVHPSPGDQASATPGQRCCSCPPSSTRSSSSATGSPSCTAARSSRSSTAGPPIATRSAC